MFKITHERADPAPLPTTAYSPALEGVILKALEPRPEDRYASLRDMHLALEAAVRAAVPRLLAAAKTCAEAETARAEGRLYHARRLLREAAEMTPGDPGLMRDLESVERSIREHETEELAAVALTYAAERNLDLATRIAGRIEALAPGSDRARRLRAYLQEETARQVADAFTATAQEHLALGRLREAHAAANEAVNAWPAHTLAREIRDRIALVLLRRPGQSLPPDEPLTPLPEGPPSSPKAARLLDSARRHIRARAPAKALPLLERAAAADPAHLGIGRLLAVTRRLAHRERVESLTAAALDHFVRDDYPGARRAMEQALALEPANRKARELTLILAALGLNV
jgi:tetratricopeptide (TPR) repeat protein